MPSWKIPVTVSGRVAALVAAGGLVLGAGAALGTSALVGHRSEQAAPGAQHNDAHGQTVRDAVAACKAHLAPGHHAIGHCVSAAAHGDGKGQGAKPDKSKPGDGAEKDDPADDGAAEKDDPAD